MMAWVSASKRQWDGDGASKRQNRAFDFFIAFRRIKFVRRTPLIALEYWSVGVLMIFSMATSAIKICMES
jgi:hypothetical protein